MKSVRKHFVPADALSLCLSLSLSARKNSADKKCRSVITPSLATKMQVVFERSRVKRGRGGGSLCLRFSFGLRAADRMVLAFTHTNTSETQREASEFIGLMMQSSASHSLCLSAHAQLRPAAPPPPFPFPLLPHPCSPSARVWSATSTAKSALNQDEVFHGSPSTQGFRKRRSTPPGSMRRIVFLGPTSLAEIYFLKVPYRTHFHILIFYSWTLDSHIKKNPL